MNIKKYYKEMLKKSKNPNHKKYYKNQLAILDNKNTKKTINNLFKRGVNKIYSVKLDKEFDTMSSASIYVNKGRSYCRRCIVGELENKYLFEII
jgi:hypothetical protein